GDTHVITMLADQGYLRVAEATVPHFTTDTSRVFYSNGSTLYSIRFDGLDRRTVARVQGTTVIAPNGQRAIEYGVNARNSPAVYLFDVPMPGGGASPTLTFPAGPPSLG